MSIIRKVVIQFQDAKGVIKEWKISADIGDGEAELKETLKNAASRAKFIGYYWDTEPTPEKGKS